MNSIRTRRTLAVTVAAALLLAGAAVTLAAPATAAPGFALERLSGTDRYATAAALAREGFLDADVALLANGQNDDPRTTRNESHFPDALAGSYLSGLRGAPTLLTTEDALPRPTAEALEELGVSTVVIVGGPAAVSLSQEQQLRQAGYSVERVAGSNRYATAAAVARATGANGVGTVGGLRTAIVASGVDFPDALVMGPLAYANTLPLTITDPVRLSPETRAALTELRIQHVLVAGGDSAVGAGVERELTALGMTVRRFAGAGRTETARLVAEYAVGDLGFDDRHVDLALGLRFPDALAGGPHAGAKRSPILLTTGVDTLGSAPRAYLEDHSETLTSGHVLGGPAAITTRVEQEAEEAGQGDGTGAPSPAPTSSPSPTSSPTTEPTTEPTTAPTTAPTEAPTTPPTGLECHDASFDPATVTSLATATDGPELVQVRYADVPTANPADSPSAVDDFCQVQVEFVFDEPVVGAAPRADRFVLSGFDPALRYLGRSAVRDSEGTVVTVTFGRADDVSTPVNERESLPQGALSEVSLAAVDTDAVKDAQGKGNPIADAALGPDQDVTVSPGDVTAGPDLRSVSRLTPTSFAFDFDQPVVVLKSTGFHVITASSDAVVCTSPVASGHRVAASCAVPAGESAVRGLVESRSAADTSSSDAPMANVLQAAPVLGTDGRTSTPDLVSVSLVKPFEKPGQDAEVAFTFDQPVFAGQVDKFVVYGDDTVELASKDVTSVTGNVVHAAFRYDLGDAFAGGAVLAGAVRSTTEQPNREDELSALGDLKLARGMTLGPDLIGFRVLSGPSQDQAPPVELVFDDEILPNVVVPSLSLFTAKNEHLICTLGARTGERTVTCTSFRIDRTPATAAQVRSAVLATADDGAVRNTDTSAKPNVEGAALTTAPSAS